MKIKRERETDGFVSRNNENVLSRTLCITKSYIYILSLSVNNEEPSNYKMKVMNFLPSFLSLLDAAHSLPNM